MEKTDDVDAVNSSQLQKVVVKSSDENYYKSRIMSLNEEIIDLNKKNKALNNESVTLMKQQTSLKKLSQLHRNIQKKCLSRRMPCPVVYLLTILQPRNVASA